MNPNMELPCKKDCWERTFRNDKELRGILRRQYIAIGYRLRETEESLEQCLQEGRKLEEEANRLLKEQEELKRSIQEKIEAQKLNREIVKKLREAIQQYQITENEDSDAEKEEEDDVIEMDQVLMDERREDELLEEEIGTQMRSTMTNLDHRRSEKDFLLMLSNTVKLKFSNGTLHVHPFVMDRRLPGWRSEEYQFERIPLDQGTLIIHYLYQATYKHLYGNLFPLVNVCTTDILILIKALHILKIPRLMALCHDWLKWNLNTDDCEMAVAYVKKNDLIQTESLVKRISRILTRSFSIVTNLGIEAVRQAYFGMFDPFQKYEELKITIPASTYNKDLELIISDHQLNIDLRKLAKLLKDYCQMI
jgi:hypothetical protein